MLGENVQFVRGIGPKKAGVLHSEAGISIIEDLLYYAPRRYLDRSNLKQIKDCFVNEIVTVGGMITRVSIAGRSKRFLEVVIDDGTDSITGVYFRKIPYFQKTFVPGEFVLFSGKIDFFRKKQIVHPDYDFIDEDSSLKSIHTGRVVPLYRSSEKLKAAGFDSRGFRRILRHVIDTYLVNDLEDFLDPELRSRNGLVPLRDALFSLHFPETLEDAEKARKRLAFNELFFLFTYLGISRKSAREAVGDAVSVIDRAPIDLFIGTLPFKLTPGQKECIDEILFDMGKPFPMNRLLQGDVGSGKTIIAMAAALGCVAQKMQCSVMAPTEILAVQHYNNFTRHLPAHVRTGLLTGSTPAAAKKKLLRDISAGETDILIGTHALLNTDISFMNPGLVIIDEQHRFGVNQRSRLRAKGENAHLLVMTATPIPRSLALTLYGDLELSILRGKPADRPPITTFAFSESRLRGIYNSMEKYISEGRQIYYVLPLIEESEKLDIRSAVKEYEHLRDSVFRHRRVDLLHGRMKADEKELAMSRFHNHETDILVSTTVIEVGIDVPNATVMVVHHAERFGLSQLHQLRGRVGRGSHRSFCILIYPDNAGEESTRRIQTLVNMDDGFKIAEEDLRLRGSGEIIGLRQHGHDGGFEFADLATDIDIINSARNEAMKIVAATDASGIEDINGFFEKTDYRQLRGIRRKRVLSLLS